MNIEDKKQNLLFKHGGTCQEERLLPKLLNNDKLIENKGLDEHLIFAYLYSDLLKFYDSQGEVSLENNVWRYFLEADDTVIYSLILHTKTRNLKSPISNAFVGLKNEKAPLLSNKYLQYLLATLEELLVLINYWYENLSNGSSIRLEIFNLINRELKDNITVLYNLLKQEISQEATEVPFHFFEFIENLWERYDAWERNTKPFEDILDGVAIHKQVQNTISDLFESILNGMSNLQKLAQSGYNATLINRKHKPQTALLIAFLRLMDYATTHLNHLTQRHLDYYYREVLRFQENPITPDKVYVYFKLKEKQPNLFLRKGEQLLAGKDQAGEDILFETDQGILVSQARIAQIHTLVIEKNRTTGNTFPNRQLYMASYTPEEIYSRHEYLNLFAVHKTDKGTNVHSPIGFLIGSPILYLKEGKREIKLTFNFNKKTFETLSEAAKQQAVDNDPTTTIDEFVSELFSNTLQIQLTTEEGWFKVAKTAVSIVSKADARSLTMTLSLMPDVLPIIKLNAAIHGEDFATVQSPCIRILFDINAPFAHLFLFKKILIEKIKIHVNVMDYRGLILQNDLGLIDANKPFQPFGPFPKLHANFYIGSDEIFYKNLTKFAINITWLGLPTLDNGFKKYYEAYPGKISNQDFQVNVSFLQHRQWNPFYPENRQKLSLFAVEKKLANTLENLKEKRTLDQINLDKLSLIKKAYTLDPPLWTEKTLTGFLKLELIEPEIAFGHTIYPSLVAQMNTIKEQNKVKHKKDTNLPTLNEPYTPVIKSISLDYAAEDEIDLQKIDSQGITKDNQQYFIELMPFGYQIIFPTPQTNSRAIVAKMEEDELCFFALGIASLNASIINLFIQLDESSLDPDQEISPPTWSYLSDNNWLPFKEHELVADDTMGLTKSGILTLALPQKITNQSTIMNNKFFWIRAAFSSNELSFPIIKGIYTHAVSATRKIIPSKLFDKQPTRLPAHIIGNLVNNPIVIESISQPFPSFGGKAAETQVDLYTRVSERLRHKNRAISAWDYERIVLEKFPEVFRVKCINHSKKDKPFVSQPGKIMLVIIPHFKYSHISKNNLPQASKQLLGTIKQAMKNVISPFVDLEVINPLYEEVKVNLEVKFKKGYEKGIFTAELQKSIKQFLSPWLFNKSEDIRLGVIIPSSKIMDFIGRQYYVEAIGNFSILKYTGCDITKITDYDNQLMSTYPWSVMVSSENHRISVVDTIESTANFRYGGVNDMCVEDDFIIGPWRSTPERNWADEVKEDTIQESLEEYYLVTKKYINN